MTSLKNPRVRNVIELRERKNRDAAGLTIVEGWREVSCAWEAKAEFTGLFVCPDFFSGQTEENFIKEAENRKVPVIETDKQVFSKISFGDRKEGLLAVCRPKQAALSSLKLSKNPFLVIVEQVEKPGNLGAIMRTCDAAGVDALIVTDAATDLYNPNVIRASLGTVFSLAVISCSNEEVLRFLKEKKIRSCATLPGAQTLYTKEKSDVPLAVVLGSEEKGLSGFWTKNADAKVKIPMAGLADSLNVSTTAAIVIYEVIRQRNFNHQNTRNK